MTMRASDAKLTCVLVVLGEVHRAQHMHVVVVDAPPVEDVEVEMQHLSDIVKRLVGSRVLRGSLALDTDDLAGETRLARVVLSIVDGSPEAVAVIRLLLSGTSRSQGLLRLLASNALLDLVRADSPLQILELSAGTSLGLGIYVVGFGDVAQHLLRYDGLTGSIVRVLLAAARQRQGSESCLSGRAVGVVVSERLPSNLAMLFRVGSALGNTAEQVLGHDRADVRVVSHVGWLCV